MEFYNPEYKIAFMNTYHEDSNKINQALGLFRRTEETESKLEKDLFDMTYSELDDMIKGMGYKNTNTVSRDLTVINQYINWAVLEGHTDNLSFRRFSLAFDQVSDYVYSKLNTIYTWETLKQVMDKEFEVYALLAWLSFEGFGHNSFDEIQNMKSEDLSEENSKFYLTVRRGKFSISRELYSRLIKFDKVLNDPKMNSRFTVSPYIFKPFAKQKKYFEIVIHPSIRNRAWVTFKEALQDDTFESRTLKRSGINYYVYKYMVESGEMILTLDILKKVSDRFNFGKNKSGYLHKKILEHIYIDFIKKHYGDFEIDDYVKSKM